VRARGVAENPDQEGLIPDLQASAFVPYERALTLMETLVRPKEIGDSDLRDDYYFAFTTLGSRYVKRKVGRNWYVFVRRASQISEKLN